MISDVKKFYNTVSEDEKLYKDIKNRMLGYDFKNGISKDFVQKELIPVGESMGLSFTCEEVLEYERSIVSGTSEISDEDLLKVSGGKMNRKVLGVSFLSMMLYGGAASALESSKGVEVYRGGEVPIAVSSEVRSNDLSKQISLSVQENDSERNELIKFLWQSNVSEAQLKAFEITNALTLNEKRNVAELKDISSVRYGRYKGSIRTRVERILDEAVSKGDLPIREFLVSSIAKVKQSLFKDFKSNGKCDFIIPKEGVDALDMHKYIADESIVQVASQFNALESVNNEPSSVSGWIYDRTQGPRAALQSVAGAKHRESAHLQGKLPDAMQDLLDKCMVQDETGQPISITKKYPELYKNGYLDLCKVSNEVKEPKKGFIKWIKEKLSFDKSDGNVTENKSDLKLLRDYIHNNIGQLKFLSQWVKCEGTGKVQLQVFNAAPSFQDENINWDSSDEKVLIYKDICKDIVVEQYRALAQVAAIKSQYTAEPVPLHLTLVGQGVFKNPPQVMKDAIKAVHDEVKDANVKVYLHGYTEESRGKWADILKNIDVKYQSIDIKINS